MIRRTAVRSPLQFGDEALLWIGNAAPGLYVTAFRYQFAVLFFLNKISDRAWYAINEEYFIKLVKARAPMRSQMDVQCWLRNQYPKRIGIVHCTYVGDRTLCLWLPGPGSGARAAT